jgi:aspartate kinase
MIVQNVQTQNDGVTDISFTLPKTSAEQVLRALEAAHEQLGYESLRFDDQIGKVSLVGSGMRTNIGVSARLFEALNEAGINIDMISTSEIRISIITNADVVPEAARVIHTAFGLDGDSEAVVYAGTGR